MIKDPLALAERLAKAGFERMAAEGVMGREQLQDAIYRELLVYVSEPSKAAEGAMDTREKVTKTWFDEVMKDDEQREARFLQRHATPDIDYDEPARSCAKVFNLGFPVAILPYAGRDVARWHKAVMAFLQSDNVKDKSHRAELIRLAFQAGYDATPWKDIEQQYKNAWVRVVDYLERWSVNMAPNWVGVDPAKPVR